MIIKSILADDTEGTKRIAETLGFPAPQESSTCEPTLTICAQPGGETIRMALLPPFVGLVETNRVDPSCWAQGGKRFRLHLQCGGLALALRTVTAYSEDVAHLFSEALHPFLRNAGFICPSDMELVIHEALANAMIHGNLEINRTPSGSVEEMLQFGEKVETALATPLLADRMVWLSAAIVGHTLHLAVEDQGAGYQGFSGGRADRRPHGMELIADSVLSMRRENDGRCLLLELPLTQRQLPRQAFADASVLIVDDNPFNRRMLEALISTLGVGRVDSAQDGIEGLAAIAEHRPDLVLLDVMMPRMDGFEMCRRLRADHALLDLPVLFVTALDDTKSRSTCFAAGGNDVVSKPIEAEEVLARVRVHLQNALLMARLNADRNRVREELEAAREAQETLAPTPSQLAAIRSRLNLNIKGVVENSSEMGGDFWTLYDAGPKRLGVLAADFTGHGLPAAFNVFRLHVLLSRLPRRPPSPAELLVLLNRELKALLKPGQFAALFVGLIDLEDESLTYAGAATPAPILIDADGPRYLNVEGPPLGAFADAEYEEHRIAFPVGSRLFVYSDALVESQVDGREICDEETLLHWIAEAQGDVVTTILRNFHARIPGDPPDDLTLLHIRREAPTALQD